MPLTNHFRGRAGEEKGTAAAGATPLAKGTSPRSATTTREDDCDGTGNESVSNRVLGDTARNRPVRRSPPLDRDHEAVPKFSGDLGRRDELTGCGPEARAGSRA